MFVNIDSKQYELIKATPGLEELAKRYEESLQELVTYATQIAQARDDYARPSGDNLEIDDEPCLSVGDDGLWVSAWVWVRFPEPEDEDEDNG